MRKKRGEILIELGLITEQQLQYALLTQKTKKAKIEEILVGLGFVTRKQIIDALARRLKIPIISCKDIVISDALLKLVPIEIARKQLVLPVEKKDHTLVLAMSDPLDYGTIDHISFMTKLRVSPVISYEWEIVKAIEQAYGKAVTDVPSKNLSINRTDYNERAEKIEGGEAGIAPEQEAEYPVVGLVEKIISEAIAARASDVHIEPWEKLSQVRYRIDGMLRVVHTYEKKLHDGVVSKIKILSGLDITKKYLPQDGSTHISSGNKEVDLRISTLPAIHGEKIVLRLLDKSANLMPLEDLAMSDSLRNALIEIFKRPQGMLIVTGPTGSGKTTTLYACLNQLRSESTNIVTIEDPVEYKVEGITQVQINDAVGRTFASVLRAVLRQDPDIIKVGEIRDKETAEIAMRASLTGHFVLTTLHTNSTIATIPRLIDIGIPTYLISSAITAILAQRLVRKICENCKVELEVSDEMRRIAEHYNGIEIERHYMGTGCTKCSYTGYFGRAPVYEYLPLTSAFRKLITDDTGEEDLRVEIKKVKEVKFVSMFESALDKVVSGITTFEEILAKVPT
ncbi:MAG: type II/IV secretion system protein [Deltaproteobacteria bacterium]|nr:MAG: type II/IV secretion system protein [Deltaproteobacteria bacterium]